MRDQNELYKIISDTLKRNEIQILHSINDGFIREMLATIIATATAITTKNSDCQLLCHYFQKMLNNQGSKNKISIFKFVLDLISKLKTNQFLNFYQANNDDNYSQLIRQYILLPLTKIINTSLMLNSENIKAFNDLSLYEKKQILYAINSDLWTYFLPRDNRLTQEGMEYMQNLSAMQAGANVLVQTNNGINLSNDEQNWYNIVAQNPVVQNEPPQNNNLRNMLNQNNFYNPYNEHGLNVINPFAV